MSSGRSRNGWRSSSNGSLEPHTQSLTDGPFRCFPRFCLLAKQNEAGVGRYLERVVTWLGDTHQGEAAGLASYHADSREEADFLLSGVRWSMSHTSAVATRTSPPSFSTSRAAFELRDVYNVAFNDIAAVDLTPVVPLPMDDASQYLVSGRDVDVPLNTSPKYAESADGGDGWRTAAHHDDDLSRYLFGAGWAPLGCPVALDRHSRSALGRTSACPLRQRVSRVDP